MSAGRNRVFAEGDVRYANDSSRLRLDEGGNREDRRYAAGGYVVSRSRKSIALAPSPTAVNELDERECWECTAGDVVGRERLDLRTIRSVLPLPEMFSAQRVYVL